ncbi:MAG: hypothetical protein U0930_00850 [Pirellulales bacterium]
MHQAIFQIDQPRSGVENMALDQSMLEATDRDQVVRLRLYRWSEPTVSLGYFQKYVEFESYIQRLPNSIIKDLALVRRATGGGAIVHHHDWTYSISMPASAARAIGHGASTGLYDSAHQAVVAWLKSFGMVAELWKPDVTKTPVDASEACSTDGCAFLCFQRRHNGDVVLNGYKIMGSAQRRFGTAVLQHGSLLLAASPLATVLPGLKELGGDVSGELKGFSLQLVQQLSADFRIEFQCCNCIGPIVPIAEQARLRFESRCWNARM